MKIPSLISQLYIQFNNARDRHTEATQPIVDFLSSKKLTLPPPPNYAYATISDSKTGNTKTKKEGLQLPQFYQATADNTGEGLSPEEQPPYILSPGEQQRLENIKAGRKLFDNLDDASIKERHAKESLRKIFGGDKWATLKFSDADLLGAAAYQYDYGVNLSTAMKMFIGIREAAEETYDLAQDIGESDLPANEKLREFIKIGIITQEDIEDIIDSQSDDGGLGVSQNPNPVKPTNPGGGTSEEPVTNSDPAEQEAQETSKIVTDTQPDSKVNKSTNPLDWEALRNGVVKRRTTTDRQTLFEVPEEQKPDATVKIDPQEVVVVPQEQEETNPAVEKQEQEQRTKQKSPNIQSNGF